MRAPRGFSFRIRGRSNNAVTRPIAMGCTVARYERFWESLGHIFKFLSGVICNQEGVIGCSSLLNHAVVRIRDDRGKWFASTCPKTGN